MGHKKIFCTTLTLLLLMLTILPNIIACTCIPEMMSDHNLLIINNGTDDTLSIYTQGYLSNTNELRYVWDIAPCEKDEELWVFDYSFSWNLVAKNSQGETVFSEEITQEKFRSSGLRRGDNHYVYVIDISLKQKVSDSIDYIITDNTTIK